MINSDKVAKGLRWFQGALAAVAGAVIAQPDVFTQFVPIRHQGTVMAGIAVISAILPSLMGGPIGKGLAGGFVAGYKGRKQVEDPDSEQTRE